MVGVTLIGLVGCGDETAPSPGKELVPENDGGTGPGGGPQGNGCCDLFEQEAGARTRSTSIPPSGRSWSASSTTSPAVMSGD